MPFSTALDGTLAGNFLLAALALSGMKVLAALAQGRLMRGNYRELPKTAFFRAVYVTGKVTPALAMVCAFVAAVLRHDRFYGWLFGCAGVFIALLAMYVVRLRQQGKFFGVLELLSSQRR